MDEYVWPFVYSICVYIPSISELAWVMVKWHLRVSGVRSGPRFNSVDRIECVWISTHHTQLAQDERNSMGCGKGTLYTNQFIVNASFCSFYYCGYGICTNNVYGVAMCFHKGWKLLLLYTYTIYTYTCI